MAGLNVLDTFEDVHAAGDEIEPEAFEQLSAIKGALATANHIPLLAFLHTCCFFLVQVCLLCFFVHNFVHTKQTYGAVGVSIILSARMYSNFSCSPCVHFILAF